MIKKIVIIHGKQAAYWERNPEATRVIVMLHGFRGNHKGLTDISAHFDEFRVILPDWPGYGESEPLDVANTIVHYAQWLDDFVAALGLDEWTSWSHSLGGPPALIQATTGKHKPTIFISVSLAAVRRNLASRASTLYYRSSLYLPPRLRKRWIASRLVDRATGRWLFQTVSTRRRKELQRRGELNLAELNPTVVAEQYLSSLGINLNHYAAKLKMPALIIAGAKDIIVGVDRLKELVRLMPHGALVVMPDQGHLAPLERPAATATITKRYLTERTKKADTATA